MNESNRIAASLLCRASALLVCLVLLGILGCSSGPILVRATEPTPPKWTEGSGGSSAGKRFFVGRSAGTSSSDDGFEMASNDALRAVVRELGITIQEESSDIQRERDGEYSYSVQIRLTTKSRPVRLARVERVKLYQETWERPATEYDSWMLLSVPESELARARRQLEGKVLMAWECRAVPDSLCRQALLEPIAAVATAGGYALLPEYVQAPPQADLVALGITQDAAYVLHISMEAEFAQESHGEFYATGHGQLRLIDTGDGKVLLSLESGPLKGGQFCRSKAIEVALEGIIRVLAEQLGTGSGL